MHVKWACTYVHAPHAARGGNAAYHVPEDLADLYYYFLLLLTTTTAYHVPEDLADLGVGERGRLDILRVEEGADGEG